MGIWYYSTFKYADQCLGFWENPQQSIVFTPKYMGVGFWLFPASLFSSTNSVSCRYDIKWEGWYGEVQPEWKLRFIYTYIYICIYIYIDDISMRTCTDGEANLWCRWESREIKGNLLGLIWEHLLLLGMLDLHPQKGIKINYWCMSIWTYHCGDINLTTLPSNMEMHIRSTFWIPILLAIDTWLRLIE